MNMLLNSIKENKLALREFHKELKTRNNHPATEIISNKMLEINKRLAILNHEFEVLISIKNLRASHG
jgi:hypothetical protein